METVCSFEGTRKKKVSESTVWHRIDSVGKKSSSIAQSVERAAVNRVVVGSSPTRGVKENIIDVVVI